MHQARLAHRQDQEHTFFQSLPKCRTPTFAICPKCNSKKKKRLLSLSLTRLPRSTKPNPLALLQWLLRKRGPLTSVACDHGGFVNTDPAAHPQPDLQLRFIAARAISPSGMSTLVKMGAGAALPSGFTTQLLTARPHSSGRVRLSSADPLAKPRIEGLYLSEGKVQHIPNTPFSPYVATPFLPYVRNRILFLHDQGV